jgi:hypothetical protein
MTCPECGERAWRWQGDLWTCRQGHRTVRHEHGARELLLPPEGEWPWWDRLPGWVPVVGGGCGAVALLIELAVRVA